MANADDVDVIDEDHFSSVLTFSPDVQEAIDRATVLQIQKELDPAGVAGRERHVYRNAGPNFLIHLDGCDKLKPYGFAIHGCLDGYSGRVLWLTVCNTNNDPAVAASYFLDYIGELQGIPRCVQMDELMENGTIEDIQKAFRWFHDDDTCGENSVRKGSSHSNQRIEQWWSTLRNSCTRFWIDRFKDMIHTGHISTSNALQIECLRFCFTDLIQRELDQVSLDWNQHQVCFVRHSESPPGKPDIMYYSPELYGTHDYKFPVAMDDVDAAQLLVTKPALEKGCAPEFCELAWQFINHADRRLVRLPESADEAFQLYELLYAGLSAGN